MFIRLFFLILLSTASLQAQTWTGGTDANWNNANNWSPVAVPIATDDVTISASATFMPAITSSVSINQLNVEAGASVTIGAAGQLTCNAAIVNDGTISLTGGNLRSVSNITNNGTFNIGAGRTLQLGGDFAQNNALNASGTLELLGTGNQSIGGSLPLNLANLVINKTTGTITLSQTLNTAAALTLPAAVSFTLDTGGNLNANAFTNNGTLNINSANATFTSNVVNNASINLAASRSLMLHGNFTNNATFNAGVGSNFNLEGTNLQILNGTSSFLLENFNINKANGTVTLGQSLSSKNALDVPAGVNLILSAGVNYETTGNVNIAGALNATAGSSFTLSGTANQTLQGGGTINLDSLTISKTTGTVTIDTDLSINQDLTIPTGVSAVLAANRQLSLGNNLVINGTFDNSSAGNTIDFSGANAASISGGSLTTFQNLSISKDAGVNFTIDQSITVNENVTINSGNLQISTFSTLNLAGNFVNNGNNFIAPVGSIVNLIGVNNQTLGGASAVRFYQLQVSKTAGTLFINRNPIEVVQDFTIPAGVSLRINPGENLDVYNDFINDGVVLPNDGGVRFVGTGTAELRGTGTMTFRDVFVSKTGAGNNVSITVPINVASWFIIGGGSQLSLAADITVGAAGGIARLRNDGTFTHNNHKLIVEGGGNYNIQGNTETVFYEIEITKTNGSLVFDQSADILQNFTVPTGVSLRVEDNIDLRLEGNLIMNGTNDDTQTGSAIYFTGVNDATISGTGVPITFRNFFNAKTNNNTVTITVDTQYQYNFQTNAGNTTRLETSVNARVVTDFDTRVYGTLSLADGVVIDYDNGNTELSIENGGLLVNDIGSYVTLNGRLNVQSGGGTCTVSNNSTLEVTGRVTRVEWTNATLNLNPNATLIVHRDLQLNNNAVLNIDNTAWIEFRGGDNSDIEGGNNELVFPNLRINKTGDQVDLLRDVRITNYLDLVNRNINSSDANLLIFDVAATHSGGSVDSYIDGTARKIGNTNFEFPIGKNGRFGKVGITVTSAGALTDYFDAEYFGVFFTNTSLAAPITDVSDREYWQIERSGATTANIVLHWTDDIASGIGPTLINRADLRVIQWNPTALNWENRGNSTGTPTNFLASDPGQNNFAADQFWSIGIVGGDNPNWGASTWIGGVSDDWDNPNNWQPAIVPDETITAIIIGDRVLTGNNDPVKKLGGLARARNLLLPRVIYPTATPTTQKPQLTVDAGFTIQVGDGTADNGMIDCYGDIVNNGTITNEYDFYIRDEAIVNNNATINAGRDLFAYENAVFNNNTGATLTTGDDLQTYNNTVFNNDANIALGGRLEMRDASIMNNQSNGVFTTGDRIYLYNTSELTNDNLFESYAQIDLNNNSVFNNNATVNTGTNPGTAGTFTMGGNTTLNNAAGATITLTTDVASSVFLNDNATINNEGTLTSGRQFELRNGGVTVTNEGLIRWRGNFMNNGSFSGSGTLEVYDNYNNTQIYGSTSPVAVHNFNLNRTGGTVNQEGNCIWTNAVTIPAPVTYDIENGVSTTVQGDFTNNGTLNIITNAQLFLEENFTNNGISNINDNTTVTLQGTANGLINGTSGTSFFSLHNNKTAATTDIEQNIAVREHLRNISGTLNLSTGFSMELQQDFVNNANFNAEANTTVTLAGGLDSEISGSNAIVFANLAINKTGANVTLSRAVEVNESLTLTEGLVNTDASNLLTLQAAATSTEGNATSFVNGPMRKYVDGSDFVFPTGRGTRWARIAISDLANVTSGDYFTANYSPWSYTDLTVNDLNHVSKKEHWLLDRNTGGTTEARVTLYWESGTFSEITDLTDLKVAHYTTVPFTGWNDRGAVTTGTTAQGSITTANRQGQFSPWTFGSETGVNPLPVSLVEFNANLQEDGSVLLDWTSATEVNVSHFEVERSQNAINFETLQTVDAIGNSSTLQRYQSLDANPKSGENYYRLKMVDEDGSFAYSPIRSVMVEEVAPLQVDRVYPNPVRDLLNLELTLPEASAYQIVIYDMQGRVVYNGKQSIAERTQENKQIDLTNLAAGTYILKVNTKNESISKRIIKL